MKHRILSLLTAAVLVLSCACTAARAEPLSPAEALEVPPFSDVDPADWYAPYVSFCVEEGLMKGVADGVFAPEDPLSQPEALTLALRLYDRFHGGDGTLPAAPAGWGSDLLSLELDDGTILNAYASDPQAVNFQPTGMIFFLEKDNLAWGAQQNGKTALLRHLGQSYSAELEFGTWGNLTGLMFPVTYGDPFYSVYHGTLSEQRQHMPSPEAWYRDAWYYQETHGLSELFHFSFEDSSPASRMQFVSCLGNVGAELESINTIDMLPDLSRAQGESVYRLYEAGILTGDDAYGTFHGEATLTRAQAAALTARLLRPELRLSFSPKPLSTENYTLTWLADGASEFRNTSLCSCYTLTSDGSVEDTFLMNLEGEIIPWPEGSIPSSAIDCYLDYLSFGVLTDELSIRLGYGNLQRGVMDGSGNYVVPLGAYDRAIPARDGSLIARNSSHGEDDWFLLDSSGTLTAKLPPLDGVEWWDFNDGMLPLQDSSTWLYGYVDQTGGWALQPRWAAADPFSSGYATVQNNDGLWGIIDTEGNQILPCQYPWVSIPQNSPGYISSFLFLVMDSPTAAVWMSPDGETLPADAGFCSSYWNRYHNGYAVYSANGGESCFYVGLDGSPVSQSFDWAGSIGPDGRGFVGLDGAVYRIEFQF